MRGHSANCGGADGSWWVSRSSKPLRGTVRCHGWVRLPYASAASPVGPVSDHPLTVADGAVRDDPADSGVFDADVAPRLELHNERSPSRQVSPTKRVQTLAPSIPEQARRGGAGSPA